MSLYNNMPFHVSCPTSTPISIAFPTVGNETGVMAVQDGAIPQILTTVVLTSPDIARFAIAFDRFLFPLSNVVAATPTPPSFIGSTTVAPNSFSGIQILNTDVYTITAGISFVTTAGIIPGALIAEIVLFPGGVGTNTPTTLSTIPLSLSTLTELSSLSMLRGTVRIANISLSTGDIIQIQIIQTSDVDNDEDLIIDYGWLEVE